MEPEKKSNGAFIGLIIIIIILIAGGIYIWQSNQKAKKLMQDQAKVVTEQDAAALNALQDETEATDTDINVDANAIN